MFEQNSRYGPIENAVYQTPDGRNITYKRRRFLPHGETLPRLAEVLTRVDDRLDRLTARTLGDPEQFWQICDANNAMNPFDLASGPGVLLSVPLPQFREAS